MKTAKEILYYAIVIAWIGAPILLNDVLHGRGIILPTDINAAIFIVWYGAGVGFIFWRDKDKPKSNSSPRGPSYRKNTDDWMQ